MQLIMKAQLPLGRYIHLCLNETPSLYSKSTRLNPYFNWIVLLIIIPAKKGIKSCKFARECVLFCLFLFKFYNIESEKVCK